MTKRAATPPFFIFYVLSLLLLFTAHVNLLMLLTKGIISFREDSFERYLFASVVHLLAGRMLVGGIGRKRIGTGLVLSH